MSTLRIIETKLDSRSSPRTAYPSILQLKSGHRAILVNLNWIRIPDSPRCQSCQTPQGDSRPSTDWEQTMESSEKGAIQSSCQGRSDTTWARRSSSKTLSLQRPEGYKGSNNLPCSNKHTLLPEDAAREIDRASRDNPRGLEQIEETESRGEESRKAFYATLDRTQQIQNIEESIAQRLWRR